MFERLSNGLELAKQSCAVLRLDKELLLVPLLSGLACLAVMASFALPLWDSEYLQTVLEDQQAPADPLAYVILFACYFANYFVIVFFNAALIACAIIRFHGCCISHIIAISSNRGSSGNDVADTAAVE